MYNRRARAHSNVFHLVYRFFDENMHYQIEYQMDFNNVLIHRQLIHCQLIHRELIHRQLIHRQLISLKLYTHSAIRNPKPSPRQGSQSR